MNPDDPYDLNRFLSAQEGVYERALAELKGGQKRTHWMWFIFPQVDGLGTVQLRSVTPLRAIEEARQYLNHPVLGKRLFGMHGSCGRSQGRINFRNLWLS